MKILHIKKWPALLLCAGLIFMQRDAGADDIDIFVGASGGHADAPNVMFLIDNSPNWSRAAQKWPDNGGTQGAAELMAASGVLNTISASQPMNVGLAMLNSVNGGGGYIRFGARDMSMANNRTALQNILTYIAGNYTSPSEKVAGMANKDESAGLYEIYKYFNGLAPFAGTLAQNPQADVAGNAATYTASGQGLTAGFAISGGQYQSPVSAAQPCAKSFIIYIANNANNTGSAGSAQYEAATTSALTALAPTNLDNWSDEWTKFLYKGGAATAVSSAPTVATASLSIGNATISGLASGTSTVSFPNTMLAPLTVTVAPGLAVAVTASTVSLPVGGSAQINLAYPGSVVTYVLDAYNAQQNTAYSAALMSAAKFGGGRYFKVGSQADIAAALATIFVEIQGVNSTFASASLPVNTSNRAQDKNQVFIPMFRPDPAAQPRWMGNLKQYQLTIDGASVSLGDAAGNAAVSTLTGFSTDCSTSFWTSDSGTYWSGVTENPVPKGACPTTVFDPYSDAPDGPFVEKGGVAEVVRKGNNPPATTSTPTWVVNRTVYTRSSGALTGFTTATSGLSASLVNFLLGQDVNDENGNGNVTESRPSLHGDVIHSRPVPIDYGSGVTTYYGSNDGTLRAIDASSGRERWAFIAPEFFPTLSRLMSNNPLINYPGMSASLTPTPTRKDYYFDGSIGLYQNSDNTKVWIYPTMRRGGRKVYALDVTNPGVPTYKWSAGCPNLGNDTACTDPLLTGIGQTWSMPVVATTVKGYAHPVVVLGGGYDNCEDGNTATPSCATPKGASVYVFDADSGTLLKSFATTRGVVADVALVGVANPGVADHAYVADLGGNIYRIDFGATTADWVMNRVAYTNGAGRKFFFAPALLPAPGGKVYLALGSGDREHPLQSQYPYLDVTNRFYVYRDDLSATSANNLDEPALMSNFSGATTCATVGVLPSSTPKGWFMDLNQNGPGEQTVTSAAIIGGMVVFSTNRPVPPSAGSCTTTLGEARGYWVNLFNASGAIDTTQSCGTSTPRSSVFVGGGLPPSPVTGIVTINGKPTSVIIGASQKNGGASTSISPQQISPPIPMNRKTIYWKSSIGD
ncbi:MAG TPA: hypothetical protein DCW29_17840 [Janthinobacterium sp.]|nr:hypothetical protein [Janthinobacterium sp.]